MAVGVGRAVVQDEPRRALARFADLLVEALAFQARSRFGSAWGRLAFIGKSVFGRLRVDLRSWMVVMSVIAVRRA